MSLTYERYTDKSLVVRGDKDVFGTEMKQFQGKYYNKLKGGAGWLVPASQEDALVAFIEALEAPQDDTQDQVDSQHGDQPDEEPAPEEDEHYSPPPREVARSSRDAPSSNGSSKRPSVSNARDNARDNGKDDGKRAREPVPSYRRPESREESDERKRSSGSSREQPRASRSNGDSRGKEIDFSRYSRRPDDSHGGHASDDDEDVPSLARKMRDLIRRVDKMEDTNRR